MISRSIRRGLVAATLAGATLLSTGPPRARPAAQLAAGRGAERIARSEPTVLSSDDVVRRAAGGEPVNLTGVVLEDDLDLRAIGTLRAPFHCRDCQVTGSVYATDVTFDRMLELTGTTFDQSVTFAGAVFGDRARFDTSRFLGEANFSSAHSRGDASCVTCTFRQGGDFTSVLFDRGANFLLADFVGRARFKDARFAGGANFRFARFDGGADFDRVIGDRTLDFDEVALRGEVSFSNISGAGTLSLEEPVLQPGATLFMNRLAVHDLSMNPNQVGRVQGPLAQLKVLELIERSAARRGELRLANDARYTRLSLEARDDRGVLARLGDRVFYRGAAGYLVRPSHPLAAALLLVALASVVRAITPGPAAPGPTGLGILRVQKTLAGWFRGLAASLAVAFRAKPGIQVEDPERSRSYVVAALRWAEFLAHKTLAAAFVLAVGNSNATIRQVIDALRS